MNRPHLRLPLLEVGALCVAASMACGAAQPASSVTGQALAGLEVPEKISAVMWTRREDSYTLQINRLVMPEQRRRDAVMDPARAEAALANLRSAERVQVWLLRADGTHVPPARRWETSDEEKLRCVSRSASSCPGFEVSYAFHAYLADDAVAVAMSIGDMYLIERLDRLDSGP